MPSPAISARLLGSDDKALTCQGLAGPIARRRSCQPLPRLANELAAAELRDGSVTGNPEDTLQKLLAETLPYHAAIAADRGLKLMMYEGGTHVVGFGAQMEDEELTAFFDQLNYSSEMGALYSELLAGWAMISEQPFNAFVDVYRPGKWGSAGARCGIWAMTTRAGGRLAKGASRVLSVIVPPSNEEAYIGPCLTALFASTPVPGGAEVIVVANGCRDATAPRPRVAPQLSGRGLGVSGAGPGAGRQTECAERRAMQRPRAICAPISTPMCRVAPGDGPAGAARWRLNGAAMPGPRRAFRPPGRAVTRAYARFWQRLPFARVAPGYGLFAVNAAGRARWGDFPAIISDDTFVRLQFAPEERVQVPGRMTGR
jgi:hypothetical protein